MLHPYSDFVHLVQKPARYLGGEHGAKKKDWDAPEIRARVCLAFPDVYDIGMSHLGFKILYKILNDDPRTLAERCYAPWVDMEAELRTRGVPLVSLENARPLREFDVVGFSLQFELTYTNVLSMLDLGGVPLRSKDRGDGDPLVIAGGPTATHPEPLSAFVDAFVIGDGEEAATRVALLWTDLRDRRARRAARRARRAAGRLRAFVAFYTRRSRHRLRRRRRRPSDRAEHDRGSRRVPLPRRQPDRRARGDLRSHVDRDRARLHRGVPLLPGRHDLSPGARARSGEGRRDARVGREEERLRRGEPHVALDGGLLVHRAARAARLRAPRARARLARRELAPRLRPRRADARRHAARPRERDHLRARGGQPAHARRREQERHRRAAHADGRAHLLAQLVDDEALLHDRPADRDRGGRARDRPRRQTRARGRLPRSSARAAPRRPP